MFFSDTGFGVQFDLEPQWAYDPLESSVNRLSFHRLLPRATLNLGLVPTHLTPAAPFAAWRTEVASVEFKEYPDPQFSESPVGGVLRSDATDRHLVVIRGVRVDAVAIVEESEQRTDVQRARDPLPGIVNTLKIAANAAPSLFSAPPEFLGDREDVLKTFDSLQGKEALLAESLSRETPDLRALIAVAEANLKLMRLTDDALFEREAEFLLRRAKNTLADMPACDPSGKLEEELDRLLNEALQWLFHGNPIPPHDSANTIASCLMRYGKFLQELHYTRPDGAERYSRLCVNDMSTAVVTPYAMLTLPPGVADQYIEKGYSAPAALRDCETTVRLSMAKTLAEALFRRRVIALRFDDLTSGLEATAALVDLCRWERERRPDADSSRLVQALLSYVDNLIESPDEFFMGRAEALLDEAASILELSPSPSDSFSLQAHRARVAAIREDWPSALKLTANGLEQESMFGASKPDTVRVIKLVRAQALLATGESCRGLALAEVAIARSGTEDYIPGSRLVTVARMFAAANDRERARSLLIEALLLKLNTAHSQDLREALLAAAQLLADGDRDLRVRLLLAAEATLDARRLLIGSGVEQVSAGDIERHRELYAELVQALLQSTDGDAGGAGRKMSQGNAVTGVLEIAERGRARVLSEVLRTRNPSDSINPLAEVMLALNATIPHVATNDVRAPTAKDMSDPLVGLRIAADYVLATVDRIKVNQGMIPLLEGRQLIDVARNSAAPVLVLQPAGEGLALILLTPLGDAWLEMSPAPYSHIRELVGRVHAELRIHTVTRGSIGLTERDGVAPRIADGTSGELRSALRELGSAIIGPVATRLKRYPGFVICPYRELALIPFAMLLDDTQQHLIEHWSISLIPSLSALGVLQDLNARSASPRAAFIAGDPKLSDRLRATGLGRLKRASDEASVVADILAEMGVAHASIHLHVAEDATEAAYREEVSECDVIHLACHAQLREPASQSCLFLSPDANHDGLLTASEVAQIRVSGALVFLAACDSGQGHPTTDGVLGLGQAFLEAGARAVVLSLWKVADVATFALVNRFYAQLAERKPTISVAEALRVSVLATREDLLQGRIRSDDGRPLVSSPSLWAPFFVLGDGFGMKLLAERIME